MKICLVCSAGGHLLQIKQLEKLYKKHKYFFVTFKRPLSKHLLKHEKSYFIEDPERNFLKLIKSIFQSIKILLNEKPDVIISTGAGVAVPICYFAKLQNKKIIFIESFSRIFTPSLTGRFIYPIANLFFVQWKSMKKFYKKAIYKGRLF